MTAPSLSGDGWPTLADVHREVTGLRGDVRGLCAEMRAQRRELDDHRQDNRRELADHRSRLDGLSRWRWSTAGAVAVLGSGGGLALLLEMLGRTA